VIDPATALPSEPYVFLQVSEPTRLGRLRVLDAARGLFGVPQILERDGWRYKPVDIVHDAWPITRAEAAQAAGERELEEDPVAYDRGYSSYDDRDLPQGSGRWYAQQIRNIHLRAVEERRESTLQEAAVVKRLYDEISGVYAQARARAEAYGVSDAEGVDEDPRPGG
jgi:hypothetical protein